ncbi:caf1 family ribonuclease [Niveomyces insectorum RCEF 264]|uniref:Caf1 family ribonuclease n=1 Tax=Niveomyces insectorum RCEF 264 TaxID=1081102 RepID=A0A167MAC6_9HYPO|nr:caf1 family ribonuclease [Niveomyces insectorum RCEF 264]
MNVLINRFWSQLPDVIQNIAHADYVALDLEMTGIEPRNAPRLWNPTEDEMYQRAKQGAQTFNILQLGISCLRYDEEKDAYMICSYNFHVSPLFKTDSDGSTAILARMVDRTLVVSYDTLCFLRAHRIRLEDSYVDGIQYLSRAEEREVLPRFLLRETSRDREDIGLQDQDQETQAFYNQVRDEIKTWEKDPDGDDYLNVANPHGGRVNRFQQRLIHQLLANEFSGNYVALCKHNHFMQIVRSDNAHEVKVREDETQCRTLFRPICVDLLEHVEEKVRDRHRSLRAQRGLRYIVEALAGGDFAEDAVDLLDPQNEEPSAHDATYTIQSQLRDCEKKLKSKTPVLIGHNMFLDMCFLYEAFVEPLPGTLDEFKHEIHKLFPRIIDTKALIASRSHNMMPVGNLEELYIDALKQPSPPVEHLIPVSYNKPDTRLAHQAGFDSSMTGILFLKRASIMLEAEDGLRAESAADEAPMEPAENSNAKKGSRLPEWDNEFFHLHGNKLWNRNVAIAVTGAGET